jgi:predicted dehydrogenase
MEGLSRLAEIAEENHVQILVGFQFRYHPALRKIKELLAEQVVGRPLSFRADWGEYLPDWHPWEDYRQSYAARKDLGGGVILTLTHPLDYARFLLGEVEALSAFAGKLSDLELDVEDTAEIGLRFASGVIGSVHLNYTQQPPRHQLEIVCTGGTIRWDNAGKSVDLYHAEKGLWESHPLPEDFERDTLFRDQMKHFLKVVHGEEKPVCTLQDGIWALRLALAAHQASEKGEVIEFGD